ncbi:MAG TPA: hypothetical protein VHX66_07360 [Solirubrobacteraceae bacterium]|jgi:hypothetical protein|nr:hypothetical protein [Solirubrobacteraceae bacterium]
MSELEADRIGEDDVPTAVEDDESPDVEGHILFRDPQSRNARMTVARDDSRLA